MVDTPSAPVHIQVLFSEMGASVQKAIHGVFRKLLTTTTEVDEQKKCDQLALKMKNFAERITKSEGWSCIVGVAFSASFAYNNLVHHFMTDEYAVLLFQSI